MPILMVDPFKYFSVGLHFLGQEFCIQDINLPCDTIMGSHCSANPTLYRQLLALYCKQPEHWIELCVYFHICVYTYMSTLSTAGKHWQQVNHASCIPRAFCWIWLGLASAIRCKKQWTWWISLCFFSPVAKQRVFMTQCKIEFTYVSHQKYDASWMLKTSFLIAFRICMTC